MHSGKPRDDHAQWERAVMLQRSVAIDPTHVPIL